MDINWHQIKSYQQSQRTAFEEIVCQLASSENRKNGYFTRIDAPDGGVEAYLVLENGDEIGWQAKYFFDIQDPQFKQIKESFQTALKTHPRLIKYIVCCPIDKQDPRIKGKKYLQDRWNKFVDECKNFALNQEINIDIEYWGAFELNNKLMKPENSGILKYWFDKKFFSEMWFQEQVNGSIKNLGARYSKEFNVKIDDIAILFNSIIYNELSRNDVFNKTNALFKLLKNFKGKLTKNNVRLEEVINDLFQYIHQYRKYISDCVNPKEIRNHIITNLNKLIELLNTNQIEMEEFSSEIYQLEKLSNKLKSTQFNLIDYPYLVIYGDAGIGKSHLLGDFANHLILQHKPCIFILGQRLTTQINPWSQILQDELRLYCNEAEFLGALNTIGQIQKERVPIIIDALNEGQGQKLWKDTLAGFIEKFKKYPWVALILSIRSEYKDNILTNLTSDIAKNYLNVVKHKGFETNIYQAIQSFFDYYQLAFPTEPLMLNEFKNPLFLKIFCEYRKSTSSSIDDDIDIDKIFKKYIDVFNEKISEKFEYRKSLKYVEKYLLKIAETIFHTNSSNIKYEEALNVLASLNFRNINENLFLQELISVHLLMSNQIRGEEVLTFSYEKFNDYFSAQAIINNIEDINNFKNLLKIDNDTITYSGKTISQGVLGFLSILLPLRSNFEFFEIFSENDRFNNHLLGDAFIDSLYWRNNKNFSLTKCKRFIYENIFKNDFLLKKFIDMQYKVAGKENHPLNANQLYRCLSKSNLAIRDSYWTTVISENKYNSFPALMDLIEWAKQKGFSESLSHNSRLLIAIAISWILSSTYIQLRDNATIALARLLQNNLDVAEKLIKHFIVIDDPYIFERVLSASYGALLSSSYYQGIDKLCYFLIEDLFLQSEVYPNVLVRDFARNIIEYSHIHKLIECDLKTLERIRPPYKSIPIPAILPTNEEIDKKYKIEYENESIPDFYLEQNTILSSMTTEYGRGVGWYGDFGRYTFQSHLYDWKNIDVDKLSNYAVELIFEKYGYDAQKHGKFDQQQYSDSRFLNTVERIGKKYQWLAMYEVVARLADHTQITDPATRWNDDKKQIWYNGSIEPSFRDIDPSFISPNKSDIREIERPTYNDWGNDLESWAVSTANLINSKSLILHSYQNNEWFSLDRHIAFRPEKKLGKEDILSEYQSMWYTVNAYLVKEQDFKNVVKKLKNKNFMDNRMPEPVQRYNNIFNLEYYWSPLLKIYESDYYGSTDWQEIEFNRGIRKKTIIGKVYLCSERHISEGIKNHDMSYHISAPTQLLHETLNLKNDQFAGSWVNDNGEVVIYDESLYSNNKETNLLIRKDYLEILQEKTDCRVIWTVLSEKTAMYHSRKSTEKRLNISGIYYLENDVLVGEDFYFIA